MKKYYSLYLLLILYSSYTQCSPKIVIGFVVDGFAYHALQKVKPFLQGGIKKMLESGVVYENAYYPHARPNTGPGHATLNTGALPSYHGIISNKWGTKYDTTVGCDDDENLAQTDLLHRSANSAAKGKSAHFMMVDGMAEQLQRASTPDLRNKTWSISLKSRSGIMMAGKAGKALWFDPEILQFTSSKAYFSQLPDWVTTFNKEYAGTKLEKVSWTPQFSVQDKAYNFMHINNYTYATKPSLINQSFSKQDNVNYMSVFRHMPYGNKLALLCAEECIKNHLSDPNAGTLLLWIGLSTLDKIGHTFGPDSFEYIDTIYKVDNYIQEFMNSIEQTNDPKQILYFLTADHGFMPIPELIAPKRMQQAHRIFKNKVIQHINQKVEKRFGIANIIRCIKAPNVYLYHAKLKTIEHTPKKRMLSYIKHNLLKVTGIRKVWTSDELEHMSCNQDTIESFYRKQFYKSRSGHLVFQVNTYTLVSKHANGSKHGAPYEFNTHVPLMFYQDGYFDHKIIDKKVWMPQVAPTLSALMHVSKPSASVADALPGIF